VDPRASGADVYVAGPLKWLLGGPGLAYLWVREERIAEMRPTVTSWFGARDQFSFRVDEYEPRDDAGRFSLGTPAVPTVYTALGGMEIFREAGEDAVYRRIAGLTAHLVGLLRDAGFQLRIADEAHRSGIVLLKHDDAAGAVARMAKKGIVVDHRAGYVRVSPHFYNTEAENDLTVAALREG
jgi:selenocysteine lyase/cysteine desulfurase